MSSVRVSYHWPDGTHIEAHCWADDTNPVAIAIARTSAVAALFETMAELDAVDEDDDVLFPPDARDGEA